MDEDEGLGCSAIEVHCSLVEVARTRLYLNGKV